MLRSIILGLAVAGSLPIALSTAQTPSGLELRKQAELAGRAARADVSNEQLTALLADLSNPDEKVRQKAVGQLRLLARRVDKSGGQRVQRGEAFEPKVLGLTPHLLTAADDKDPFVRTAALYALADTLDAAAVVKLREHVRDEDDKVRLTAACLLTEFQDASGIGELKGAVKQMSKSNNEVDLLHAEHVLASLQRITGKSFGEIPTQPLLMSDSRKAAVAKTRYRELLNDWVAWWDWQPIRN